MYSCFFSINGIRYEPFPQNSRTVTERSLYLSLLVLNSSGGKIQEHFEKIKQIQNNVHNFLILNGF